MRSHLNLAAVADGLVVQLDRHVGYLVRLHRHVSSVAAVARGLADHNVVRDFLRHGVRRGVAPLRGSLNQGAAARLALVPLVHESADVGVVDRRGECHLAAVADRHHRVYEGNLGRLVDVHREAIARHRAAADAVHDRHVVNVRGVTTALDAVGRGSGSLNVGVVYPPCVCVVAAGYAVVQVRRQADVVGHVLADILVARDGYRRHRGDYNRIKAGLRGTAAAGLSSSYTINISSIGIGNSHRNISVVSIRNAINHNTILVPSVCIAFFINTRLGVGGRKHDFQTAAKRIRNNVNNLDARNLVHMNLHSIRCCAKAIAYSFHLYNHIFNSIECVSVRGFRSIRSRVVSDIPLIGHVFITISDANKEFNLSVLTNRSIGSGNLRNRGSINVDSERIAFNTAAIITGNTSRISISASSERFCFHISKTCQSLSIAHRCTILVPGNLGINARIIGGNLSG